jgi:hypothetical protein
MTTTHVTNATRLATLTAALLLSAVEWAGFTEIVLRADPAQIASAPAAASPDGALPEIVVTAHGRGRG